MSTLFEENRKNLITYIQEKSQKEGSIKTDVPSLYFYSTKSLLETLRAHCTTLNSHFIELSEYSKNEF